MVDQVIEQHFVNGQVVDAYCALAIAALLNGTLNERGVLHPWRWLPPDDWIARVKSPALRFLTSAT